MLLFYLYKKLSSKQFTKITLGIVLFFVFLVRFFLEYLKTPQSEFANILPLSMGQILSLPFIIIGAILLIKNLAKDVR